MMYTCERVFFLCIHDGLFIRECGQFRAKAGRLTFITSPLHRIHHSLILFISLSLSLSLSLSVCVCASLSLFLSKYTNKQTTCFLLSLSLFSDLCSPALSIHPHPSVALSFFFISLSLYSFSFFLSFLFFFPSLSPSLFSLFSSSLPFCLHTTLSLCLSLLCHPQLTQHTYTLILSSAHSHISLPITLTLTPILHSPFFFFLFFICAIAKSLSSLSKKKKKKQLPKEKKTSFTPLQ
ncbi:MAG: hypothetical protein BYD32DRAFT_221132 [Podila humilis]|nr:MAG: hypothetical protein BYD32DRAFT_221132 [Podila humilis]